MLGFLKNLFHRKPDPNLSLAIHSGGLLIDVRTAAEFNQGHIPGSINIPIDQFEKEIPGLKNKTPIIVFCQSGIRSARAKELLNKEGVQSVVNGGSWTHVNKLLETQSR